MPIIEGRYTMTDTARELEQEAFELRCELWNMSHELERTQRREADAERRASHWAALCVVLLIAAGVLAAYAAVAG